MVIQLRNTFEVSTGIIDGLAVAARENPTCVVVLAVLSTRDQDHSEVSTSALANWAQKLNRLQLHPGDTLDAFLMQARCWSQEGWTYESGQGPFNP